MSTKPNYEDWEPHKAQIEQIYLRENKIQKELSRIMEETRVSKNKAQYEKAFERWNFKKYKMTPEKWKVVKHRIEKRKRQKGKESEVKYEIGPHAFESTIARPTSGNDILFNSETQNLHNFCFHEMQIPLVRFGFKDHSGFHPRASRRVSLRVSKHVFGIRPKRYQTTALGVAASKGDIPMLQILLAAHATVNRANNPDDYLHPLVLAVTERKKDAPRLLLEAGASLQAARDEAANQDGQISLFELALEANDLPMCQILLANGAEAGAQLMQNYYSSQLWEHVKDNDPETVALLLQLSARANDLLRSLPNSALGVAITQ
ncbi:ankyrin repeat-containing domain protein [Penicillium mononematosum]|uniref:ankyrin repeat-containing domain protein n=1 Tax=Penicillium mononematosum TaxID=268346 RepID=UPI00254899CA|nr:ankyrin repeat-containing domain protein [Penicillium mononematosum]KAJ6191430.1 ankyrin repeat-containing domain protein [Penicillium mononematosum]